MFKLTAPNRVESDDGSVIESTGRSRTEFRKNGRVLHIHDEGGKDPDDGHFMMFFLFEPPLEWQPPYQNEPVTKEDLKEIRYSLVEACKLFGAEAIFDNTGENLVRL